MLNWLRKKSWRSSEAHLLLLSKFRDSDSPDKYGEAEYWRDVLKENPINAIKRFLNEGMLGSADLTELIDYKYKITDIKNILRQRGLKVSGRKAELVQRLIENDPEGMREVAKRLNLYRCTAEGIQLTERYLKNEKAKKAVAEKDVLDFLTRQEFSKAVRVVVKYEASQVFPRGLGIDWNNYDDESAVASLKAIFERTPGILKSIEENRLSKLRLAAGMMQLWGANRVYQWLPDSFETGIPLDSNAACRMLVFYASHIRNFESYSRVGAKTVEILGVDDGASCSECRKISGKKYKLGELPELPYAKCTCGMGCRCTIIVGEFR